MATALRSPHPRAADRDGPTPGPPHVADPLEHTDEALMEQCRAGSQTAFDLIVRRYERPLLRHCERIAGAAGAQDAVQETFLSAWRAIHSGVDIHALRPWLHTVAHRSAIAAQRDRKRSSVPLSPELSDGASTADQVAGAARLRATLSALVGLPAEQRDALLASAVHGRSGRHIARQLGVSESVVHQLVFRARTSLRAAGVAAIAPPLLLLRLLRRLIGSQRRLLELARCNCSAGQAEATARLAKVGLGVVGVAVAGAGGAHLISSAASSGHRAPVRSAASHVVPATVTRSGVRPTEAAPAVESWRSREPVRSPRTSVLVKIPQTSDAKAMHHGPVAAAVTRLSRTVRVPISPTIPVGQALSSTRTLNATDAQAGASSPAAQGVASTNATGTGAHPLTATEGGGIGGSTPSQPPTPTKIIAGAGGVSPPLGRVTTTIATAGTTLVQTVHLASSHLVTGTGVALHATVSQPVRKLVTTLATPAAEVTAPAQPTSAAAPPAAGGPIQAVAGAAASPVVQVVGQTTHSAAAGVTQTAHDLTQAAASDTTTTVHQLSETVTTIIPSANGQ